MKHSAPDLARTLDAIEEDFVGLWRSMSSLWGVSPTMAEIHGLLYITGAGLSMDDIMARLDISRGNVSMNLSKLVEWGLVRRVHKRGDRRDYYESLQEQRRRVQDLLSLLSLMDSLAQRFFESNRGLRTAVELLANKKEKRS